MKIAWLHSHFLLLTGGTRFVYEVARRLNKQVPVDLFVEQCSESVHRLCESQGLKVREINTRSSTSMWYWLFFPFYVRKNTTQIRSFKNHYSFFVTSMFPMHYVATQAGLKPHLVYLFEPFAFFHDPDMIQGFPPFKRFLLSLLSACYKQWDIQGVRNADSVGTINDGTAQWVKTIYGVASRQSLLGVDTDFFCPKANSLKSRYEKYKVVIHSTDFTPLKRTWQAIQAVEKIRRSVPTVRLLITQTYENKQEIKAIKKYLKERQLQDHVELVGHLSNEDLPYYYSLADASLYTGIGAGASAASLFVLEAMACGTPGIRTDFTRDEIEHNVSGFLYRPGDEESLQKYLLELLTNDSLRKKFSQAARQRIVTHYSWDAVAKHMLDMIQGTLHPIPQEEKTL